jgi:hypothetical protein
MPAVWPERKPCTPWAAGAGQPDLQAQAGVPQNPTIDDFVNAYKPLDAAINHAFEARITKTNARATQYELASVRGPPSCPPSMLLMLANVMGSCGASSPAP